MMFDSNKSKFRTKTTFKPANESTVDGQGSFHAPAKRLRSDLRLISLDFSDSAQAASRSISLGQFPAGVGLRLGRGQGTAVKLSMLAAVVEDQRLETSAGLLDALALRSFPSVQNLAASAWPRKATGAEVALPACTVPANGLKHRAIETKVSHHQPEPP